MSNHVNPDSFNMDIPILTRARPIQRTYDRDSNDMDIPILSRCALKLQIRPTAATKDSGVAFPPTPAYWSQEMERESEDIRRQGLDDKLARSSEESLLAGLIWTR
jgi:hypothetical protein